MYFKVLDSAFRVHVEFSRSVLVVDGVALEPFLEPHCAHYVVIGHRVERVEGVLNAFSGSESNLES